MEFITLNNKNGKKLIKDLILYPLKVNVDETGGILVETLRKDWKEVYGPGREFSMQYFSVSDPSVARDEKKWHLHPNYQEDRFLVAKGGIVVAVYDNREDSETKGLLNLFHMISDKDPYILLIPKGCYHGFLVVSNEPAVLLNFPTGLYNPDEEVRVPFTESQVKMEDGQPFSWNLVRSDFGLDIR